ncbi:MAG: DUF222 domain-containing protein [Sporichthyaceae bacterium]
MSTTDDRGPGDDAGASAGTRPGAAKLRDLLRATVSRIGAVQVEQLRLVAQVAADCEAEARRELAGTVRAWGRPSVEELTHTTVVHELMVVLGTAKPAVERLIELATRLVRVLPATLAAVQAGRIDLQRAEVLSQETAVLDDACARQVETVVLSQVADHDGPWAGLSPRKWRSQIQRLVVQVDTDAARGAARQ